MTPEEKFENRVWEILQKIREGVLFNDSTEIEWKNKKYDPNCKFFIFERGEKAILDKLEKLNAIEMQEHFTTPVVLPEITSPNYDRLLKNGIDSQLLYLKILQPKFDEVYKKYEKTKSNHKENKNLEVETFEIKVKDREIWINNYLIGKPHAVGNNFEFFDYIRLQPPNTKIEWGKIPDTIGYKTMKDEIMGRRFIKILNALGFKGETKKAFFYKVGGNSLYYRGDKITKHDLENAGVKFALFIKELEVAHLKIVPNSPV